MIAYEVRAHLFGALRLAGWQPSEAEAHEYAAQLTRAGPWSEPVHIAAVVHAEPLPPQKRVQS